jgi:Ca2+:H+ antiporter
MKSNARQKMRTIAREWPLPMSVVTVILYAQFGGWLADLSNWLWFAFVFAWLFVAILIAALAVVRHSESLAEILGEPLGTLVLTLSVIGIEVSMIAAVMASGHGHPTLARDAMFAVLMIVMNGLVGLSLLLGGLKHHEQTYNLLGANSFLAVIIPLAVLGLVLPNFTLSSPGPTFSALHRIFLIVMSVVLYGVFLAIQTSRHREYFIADNRASHGAVDEAKTHSADHSESAVYHAVLLAAYLVPVVLLAKKIAIPINYGIEALGAPAALGGMVVSILVLVPESLSAVRSALANHLQRSVNLLLGSVLASISLTIPAVLTVGFFTNQSIVLGLDSADTTLLVLTLAVSMLTFSVDRTNVLLGAVHLLLFATYLVLIFEN